MKTFEERVHDYKKRHKEPIKARQSEFVRIGDLMPNLVFELSQNIQRRKA